VLEAFALAIHVTMIPMNTAPTPGLRVIVLAAGFSSRLGSSKALARVHGASLLRRTLKLAAALRSGGIVVIAPRNAARLQIESRGIKAAFGINAHRRSGLSSSVRRGISAARYCRAILLLPVDLVHLSQRDTVRLVSRWKGAQRKVFARRVDGNGAVPLILPRWLYGAARRISGDVGLRDLVRQLPSDRLVMMPLPSAAFDIDTSKDLNAARRCFRGG
jgi:molybdenum cofactor cytidylyltransferase